MQTSPGGMLKITCSVLLQGSCLGLVLDCLLSRTDVPAVSDLGQVTMLAPLCSSLGSAWFLPAHIVVTMNSTHLEHAVL
jgi:predicted RND superfamily exporter protein